MKLMMVMGLIMISVVCFAEAKKVTKTLPVKKVEAAVKAEIKKAADCDEKAKKKIEIKEETISLTGNTGCSLDDLKKH